VAIGNDKINAVRADSCRGEKFFVFSMDKLAAHEVIRRKENRSLKL
jgi:hypothetical protein